MEFDRTEFDLLSLLNTDRRFHPDEEHFFETIQDYQKQVKNLLLLVHWTKQAHAEWLREMDCLCEGEEQMCDMCDETPSWRLTTQEALQIVRLLCGL